MLHAKEHEDLCKQSPLRKSTKALAIGVLKPRDPEQSLAALTIYHVCAANKFFGHFSFYPNYPRGWEEEMILIGKLLRES